MTPDELQTISQANASSPFLKLPQEIKNLIYELVLGGRKLHITDRYVRRTDAHRLSCQSWCRGVSAVEAQKRFEETETSAWYVAGSIDHGSYYKMSRRFKDSSALRYNKNLLLSCSQVYVEAKYLPYSANHFSFDDPVVLQRSVRHLLHVRHAAAILAIRKLDLKIDFPNEDWVRSWHDAITLMAEHLTSLQTLHLSMHQGYTFDGYGFRTQQELAKVDVEWWTSTLDSLLQLRVLPLTTVTFVISDEGLPRRWSDWMDPWQYSAIEAEYRWTLEEKRKRAKDVKDILLGRKNMEANEDISIEDCSKASEYRWTLEEKRKRAKDVKDILLGRKNTEATEGISTGY